jgi:DNA ligase-4
MSDPKSRTGEEDKKTLTKLYYRPLSQDILNWVSLFLCRIYANGGTCAQIATNQPELYVIYEGSVTRKFNTL